MSNPDRRQAPEVAPITYDVFTPKMVEFFSQFSTCIYLLLSDFFLQAHSLPSYVGIKNQIKQQTKKGTQFPDIDLEN